MPRDGTLTRNRILDAAERLVIDQGFAATSVDQVIAQSGSSKGAFFHHFASKVDLAQHLVERYAAADLGALQAGLDAVAGVNDPHERVLGFLQHYVDDADALMAEQTSCLYLAVLTEQQLVMGQTRAPIEHAVLRWREDFSALLRAAMPEAPHGELDDLADGLFVTFEGAFVLSRSLEDPRVMRRQLATYRRLVAARLAQE